MPGNLFARFTTIWKACLTYKQLHPGLSGLFALARRGVLALKEGELTQADSLAGEYRDRIAKTIRRPLPPLLSETSLTSEIYQSLMSGLQPQFRPVLVIDHDLGGGANGFREDLLRRYREEGRSVVLAICRFAIWTPEIECRLEDKILLFRINSLRELLPPAFPVFVDIVYNNFVGWVPPEEDGYRGFYKVSGENVAFILNQVQALTELVKTHGANGAQSKFFMHDFFSICPSYNLLDKDQSFCSPSDNLDRCALCLKQNPYSWFREGVSLSIWRKTWSELLVSMTKVRFFSSSSQEIFSRVYSLDESKQVVAGHLPLADFSKSAWRSPKNVPLTIGVFGNLSVAKGVGIVFDLAELLRQDAPKARLVHFGHKLKSNRHPNLLKAGPYKREDLPRLIEKYKVTVGFIPSIWPETFNYVAQELMQIGLPLVSFDLGAHAERIAEWEHGMIAGTRDAQGALKALKFMDSKYKS